MCDTRDIPSARYVPDGTRKGICVALCCPWATYRIVRYIAFVKQIYRVCIADISPYPLENSKGIIYAPTSNNSKKILIGKIWDDTIILYSTKILGYDYMWFVFAILSAVFAALTSILAKVGIDGVNSTLATAIRTVVVVGMSWGMVFITSAQEGIGDISRKSWLFLILSGIATGASWLCYYRALQIGDASKVVPIDKLSVVITLVLAFVFLHEEFTIKSLIGCILIGAGTLVMVL